MRSIRDRLTGRGRYILGGVLALGVIAAVVFAAINRIGTSHTSPPAPNVKTTSIAKIISQGKLSHIGSITPTSLPTASTLNSTFPYSSGGSLATHARQAAQYAAAVTDSTNGNIWLATGYIPAGAVTPNENWGTRILEIAPTA